MDSLGAPEAASGFSDVLGQALWVS